MAFLLFGRKGKARRVPDGQIDKRRCPECGKTTAFRECVVEKTYTAYVLIDLWTSKETQFSCDACGSIMPLSDTLDPELTAREKKKLEALQDKERTIEAKRREAQRLQAQRDEAARESALDDELAAMKARLGLDD